MKHLFVLDPISTITVNKDTSSLLMSEGLNRSHDVFVIEIDSLNNPEQLLVNKVTQVDMDNSKLNISEPLIMSPDEFHVIWMRKDPPVDDQYLAHLDYFEMLATQGKTLFINDPRRLRDMNEKLTILNFPEFIPKSLVTDQLDQIKLFWEELGKIIIKPLNSFSGIGIEVIESWEQDLHLIENLLKSGEQIMAQEFLPNVYLGDKRIYILGGKVIGQLLRVPVGNSFKGNLHAGGRAEATDLSTRELMIAEEVGRYLNQKGIIFAGIDLIDEKLTEINITSPGVIIEANAVSGTKLEKDIWDYVEEIL